MDEILAALTHDIAELYKAEERDPKLKRHDGFRLRLYNLAEAAQKLEHCVHELERDHRVTNRHSKAP